MDVDAIYCKLGDERLAADEAGSYVEMWDGEGWIRSGRVHRLAAARITALERELAVVKACERNAWKATRAVEQERDRLREALREIATDTLTFEREHGHGHVDPETFFKTQAVARQALAGGEEKP